jgi:hypothetical protein
VSAKQAPIQQSLLSNGSMNKHVSMAIGESKNNGREIVYIINDERL